MTDHYEKYRERPRSPSARPALLLTGLLAIAFILVVLRSEPWGPARAADAQPHPITPRGDLGADEQAMIDLFERCSESVVYVNPFVRGYERTFFGIREVIEQGTGSGFIWDDRGHIVTNYHVVQDAAEIVVILPDNTPYKARRVGIYPDKDIAVLRISPPQKQLTPLAVGTSKDLRVGQKVLAIGNPFGLDFTLTTGVVSALNRQIETFNNRKIDGVIQTDAAINPGNSGGPLLDSAGRLIGMTTSIVTRTGGGTGIGFAVPVDTINRVVPQLIMHGRVIRPQLGVVTDDAVARQLGIKHGVLILNAPKDGGAQRAGLKPTLLRRDGRIILGDIITKVGQTQTPDTDRLLSALEQHKIGDTVEVTIERDGTKRTVAVKLQGSR